MLNNHPLTGSQLLHTIKLDVHQYDKAWGKILSHETPLECSVDI
jgi:hypothetical protein